MWLGMATGGGALWGAGAVGGAVGGAAAVGGAENLCQPGADCVVCGGGGGGSSVGSWPNASVDMANIPASEKVINLRLDLIKFVNIGTPVFVSGHNKGNWHAKLPYVSSHLKIRCL